MNGTIIGEEIRRHKRSYGHQKRKGRALGHDMINSCSVGVLGGSEIEGVIIDIRFIIFRSLFAGGAEAISALPCYQETFAEPWRLVGACAGHCRARGSVCARSRIPRHAPRGRLAILHDEVVRIRKLMLQEARAPERAIAHDGRVRYLPLDTAECGVSDVPV